MRTLMVVVGLVAVALASAASFVLSAEGGGPDVVLEHRCTPPSLPADVDTLVTCTFTARNGGRDTLRDAFLGFQPSGSTPIPDSYYFFRATHDGVELEVSDGRLTYPFGDIPPDSQSTLEVQVIVRSSHAYAADAVLVAGAGQDELARITLGGDVAGNASPALGATLTPDPPFGPDAPAGGVATFTLTIESALDAGLEAVTVDITTGEGAGFTGPGLVEASPSPRHWIIRREVSGRQEVGLFLTFESRVPCAYTRPAVAVTAVDADGRSLTAAAIASEAVLLTGCDGAGQGGGGGEAEIASLGLPAAGAGTAAGRSVVDVIHLLLLTGTVAIMRGLARRHD